MATFRKPQHFASVLLILVVFTMFSSLSSARLLNDFLSHDLPVVAETTLDLSLADFEEAKSDVVFDKSERDSKPQALPCDHMVPMKRSHTGTLRSQTQRLTGKYGPMILSRLPKGAPLPPSAPSKGSNNIEN